MKNNPRVTVMVIKTAQDLALKLNFFKTKWLIICQMKKKTTRCQSTTMRMRTELTNWSTLKIWKSPASECLVPTQTTKKGTMTKFASLKNRMELKSQYSQEICANQKRLKNKEAPHQKCCIGNSFHKSTKETYRLKCTSRQYKSATASTDWRTSRTMQKLPCKRLSRPLSQLYHQLSPLQRWIVKKNASLSSNLLVKYKNWSTKETKTRMTSGCSKWSSTNCTLFSKSTKSSVLASHLMPFRFQTSLKWARKDSKLRKSL